MYPVAAVRSLAQKREAGSVDVWIQESTAENYPDLATLVRHSIISWVFSSLQHIKSKNRKTVTQEHTTNLMRISSTTTKPKNDDIIQNINVPIQNTPH